MSLDINNIIEQIKEATIIELNELVEAIEEEFGVEAAAPVAMVAGGEAEEAEQTEFDVELTDVGGSKIQVIRAVRSATGLGLKEAKDLVDAAPNVIKEGVDKEEAEELKAALEEVGATVELK